jgi:hypothetical protein
MCFPRHYSGFRLRGWIVKLQPMETLGFAREFGQDQVVLMFGRLVLDQR